MPAHGIDPKLDWSLGGLPFSLSSIFFPCISFREKQFWVKVFEGSLVTAFLHWGPVYVLEGVSLHAPSPQGCGISAKAIPNESRSLGLSRDYSILQLHSSIHSPGPLAFSSVSPPLPYLILSSF